MIRRRLESLWRQLRGKKPHMPHFLSEIRLRGIRGIDDLRVAFDYPVSVVAGENASGKSTVLLAAACAYDVPGAGVREYAPSTLFPDYRPKAGGRGDGKPEIVLEFDYSTPDGLRSMRWRRVKGWSRSFLGRKNATQPQRPLYLRTLGDPSRRRGMAGMSLSKSAPQETPLTPSQIEFAQRILPFRYSEVVKLSDRGKSLLFANRADGAAYSELHMAAGERSILRLSQEIAQLHGALVLIDEVEAGLHPWVQQLLMMELQQLALRNDLQIIVASHSPVVLESVQENGRIFLERDSEGRVKASPPWTDIARKALYGRAEEALNLLCEDEAAEGILQGVFDVLTPRMRISRESIRIGRDTGAEEFPSHAAAFAKFGQIDSFAFILDGDKRESDLERRIRERTARDVPLFFLPGSDAPERWVWDRLREGAGVSEALGMSAEGLSAKIRQLDSIYDSASDRPSEIARAKLRSLSDDVEWSPQDVCRVVARDAIGRKKSLIQPLVEGLENAVLRWRGR